MSHLFAYHSFVNSKIDSRVQNESNELQKRETPTVGAQPHVTFLPNNNFDATRKNDFGYITR